MDSEDKMNNILVNDVGAETDAITCLRSPTHFGRPNVCLPDHLYLVLLSSLFLGAFLAEDLNEADDQWDRVFESVADKHPDTDCGVFFCGPAGLGDTLKSMCGKYTSPMGCRFYFGKEVCYVDSGLDTDWLIP
jgi:hypothetical protein